MGQRQEGKREYLIMNGFMYREWIEGEGMMETDYGSKNNNEFLF